jgi:hypothetical protein
MGIDVMVDKNRCTGTTTNDDDGCEVVEAMLLITFDCKLLDGLLMASCARGML